MTRFLALFCTVLIIFNGLTACGASGTSKKIVFLGDSMIKRGNWSTGFNNKTIVNLGIGGNTTSDILHRLDQVKAQHPKKIFLMIGINDLIQQKDPKETLQNYSKILTTLKQNSPDAHIYAMSVLPLNWQIHHRLRTTKHWVTLAQVNHLNDEIKRLCQEQSQVTFINLYPGLVQNGELISSYSSDGLHLNQAGYKVWEKEIKRFVT
jgi:lysophospholipase L1-like esterase